MFKWSRFSILLIAILLTPHFAIADSNTTRVAVTTSAFHLVKKATRISAIDPNKKITFIAWLKFRNKDQMDQLAHDIYDPRSRRYHQFMTKEEYDTIFSPTVETKQAVQRYFIDNGMDAEIVYNEVHVTGTVKKIEELLNIKMNYYRYEGQVYYGNASEPVLPAAIAQSVHTITGLTNIPRFHGFVEENKSASHYKMEPVHALKLGWKSFTPNANPTDISLRGFGPSTLQTAYQFSSITPIHGTTINGAGQTIVITDSKGMYSTAQIMADANQYGGTTLPNLTLSNFAAVDVDGNKCGNNCIGTGDGVETAIDVESSHTLAPYANIVLVVGDTEVGLPHAIEILIHHDHKIASFSNAYLISNSWGGQETNDEMLEPYLQSAMMNGIGVDFSSGDCGDNSSTSNSPKCMHNASPSHVNYPASSTYVTAVGATSLFVDDQWNYAFELGWGNYFDQSVEFCCGTSGGVSQYYGPASWQSVVSLLTAGGYGTIGSNYRALPDIGMLGDSQTPLNIVVGGQYQGEGGTSLACPLFTAVLALTNQARAVLAGGQNPVGQAAPELYNNQAALINNNALHLIIPPHQIIDKALKPTNPQVMAGAPIYAFTLHANGLYQTFGWDGTLGIEENQFWNDEVGLGSPNLPNFVAFMSGLK